MEGLVLRVYEALFIFPGSLKDEALQKVLEQARGEITKLKGNLRDTLSIGKRTFARPLKKTASGQYVRIDFSIEPENIAALLARFKLNEDIFRVQIVRPHARKVSNGKPETRQSRTSPELAHNADPPKEANNNGIAQSSFSDG